MYCKIDKEFVVKIPETDIKDFADIERGIIFLLALWSAPCSMTLRDLTETLSTLNLSGLTFYIIDVDGAPNLYKNQEIGKLIRGYGETFWVYNGKIKYSYLPYKEKIGQQVLDYTKAIL